MIPLQEKALALAVQRIGVLEEPLGSNRGPEIDKYVRSVGLDPAGHYPWCAAFVYACHRDAVEQNLVVSLERIENLCPRTGSALGMWRLSRAEWRSKIPKAGCIFVMDFGHGTGHVGFIESVSVTLEPGKPQVYVLKTVEGNTNNTGSPEGVGVFRRTRKSNVPNMVGYLNFSLKKEVT